MRKLEILNSQLQGKVIPIKGQLTIGAGERAQVRAAGDGMLDLHARFFLNERGTQVVESADRAARIYVNGKDVLRSELRNGDTLRIGPLKFRFIDDSLQSSGAMRLDALMEEYESNIGQTVYDFAKEDLFFLISRNPELRTTISFTIPSKDRFIDQAQSFLSRLTHQCGMDELKHEAFMTCTKELILNAHRHGHKYDETKVITLRFRDLGDRVALSIEDQGPGFNHRAIIEEASQADAAQAARKRYQAGGFGGLGFQLITKMSDELKYNNLGNKVSFKVLKKFPE